MTRLTNKIGVIVDSFGIGVRVGLKKAKEVGAEGVQIYAVKGEMNPDSFSAADRKELKAYIADLGLEISALCGDLGGHGFQDEQENRDKIATMQEACEELSQYANSMNAYFAIETGPEIATHLKRFLDTLSEKGFPSILIQPIW